MAYQPIDGHRARTPHYNIELENRDESVTYGSRDGRLSSTKDDDERNGKRVNQPAGWPLTARKAAEFTGWKAAVMLSDTVLASTPIMFLALALVAARLDGKDVSNYGSRSEETLLLSPTIFPVIFAALMGRFFHHLGVYLVERGTTLGRLEQLIGCQSVFTALERQIGLRSWSIVGFLSILVWLLSPVGGQSALRLLSQKDRIDDTISTFRYLDPQLSTSSSLMGASAMNAARASITSVFLAALLSSPKFQDTPMDMWGNVKLPLYRDFTNSSFDEWKPYDKRLSSTATHGSLIGIPVAGATPGTLSNFTLRARQFDITCDSNKMMPVSLSIRNSTMLANVTGTWALDLGVSRSADNTRDEYPRRFTSMSLADAGETLNLTKYSVASCELTYNYLEANVSCTGTSCGVKSMRRLDLLGDGYTEIDDMSTRRNIFTIMMNSLPQIDNINVGSAITKGSSNAEKWMADPTDFIGARYTYVKLHELDPDIFARRLTILWNTFHQSTYATPALGGALPKNLTQTGFITARFPPNITFNATQAHVRLPTGRVYKTNWKWLGALLFSSLVLLAAAYAGLVLKYITLAPDIIGYASSLTILTPYVPTPTGGTTLDGLQRAALLHDLPVRLGDVCGNEVIGAITLARADEGRVERLSRGRRYI